MPPSFPAPLALMGLATPALPPICSSTPQFAELGRSSVKTKSTIALALFCLAQSPVPTP